MVVHGGIDPEGVPLSSRRSVRLADRRYGVTSTLKGSPLYYEGKGGMGGPYSQTKLVYPLPFRVDDCRIQLSGGTAYPRVLRGDAFSVHVMNRKSVKKCY